ncbi:hypothetical protein F511_37450 [Dorcoceras hygrometricum]|uniref:Uncharacterized protein n=1 Tax=Dorcoceras hygrometricum TaxID=472368 RepID=A0A2Z7AEY2_9LAMI|nr:hypothetical protein F511_37450 [Dorcoceras hygrometricum]
MHCSFEKSISSRYICPAVGSQHYRSAVGLVFMEWAVELAMETSRVDSVVRNQAEAKLNQLDHDEPAETTTTSCKMRREAQEMMRRRAEESADGLVVDDVIGDVIIFSRWFERAVARISSLHTLRRPPLLPKPHGRRLHRRAAAAVPPPRRRRRDRTCSDRCVEEIPFVPNSSVLLVQADEGIVFPVVDLIKEGLPPPTVKARIPCESGWSQEPRRQQGDIR